MSDGGELELQRWTDETAAAFGWRKFALPTVQRKRVAGAAGVRGWPDRVYFRRGQIVVLEFKAQRDAVIAGEQVSWLDEWLEVAAAANACPGGRGLVRVAVARPADKERIERMLR